MTKDNWMKSEISIRVGFRQLAIEVCMQWVRDGKSEADFENVKQWWRLAKLDDKELLRIKDRK